jgi:hypothetical protein
MITPPKSVGSSRMTAYGSLVTAGGRVFWGHPSRRLPACSPGRTLRRRCGRRSRSGCERPMCAGEELWREAPTSSTVVGCAASRGEQSDRSPAPLIERASCWGRCPEAQDRPMDQLHPVRMLSEHQAGATPAPRHAAPTLSTRTLRQECSPARRSRRRDARRGAAARRAPGRSAG